MGRMGHSFMPSPRALHVSSRHHETVLRFGTSTMLRRSNPCATTLRIHRANGGDGGDGDDPSQEEAKVGLRSKPALCTPA